MQVERERICRFCKELLKRHSNNKPLQWTFGEAGINVKHQLVVLNDLPRFDHRLVKVLQRNAMKIETRSNVFSPFSSPRPIANALRPRRVNSSTWSFIIETKSVTTKTQTRSSFHNSFSLFSRCGSNWKIRLFPKPSGRIPKRSRFCATVSKHNFCSRFKLEIWRKCCKELLKAASNSTSVTELCIACRSLGKNYANLQAVLKICQLFISELSTVINSTNQILIPGAGIMEW